MKINKKYIVIASIILVIVIATVSIYFYYYKHMQKKIRLDSERTFYINQGNEDDIEKLAKKWVEEYSNQYKQKYLEAHKKLKAINITNVEVLDVEKNIVRVDFTATMNESNNKYFSSWGNIEKNKISCEWVITFFFAKNNNNVKVVQSIDRVTPEKYEENKNKDVNPYSNLGDYKLYEKKDVSKVQYSYKINNKKCYVTYDSGNNFIEVPISLDNLTSGYTAKNSLKEGTYQISSKKTVFLYGNGGTVPFSMIYSNDRGITWKTVPIITEKIISNQYVGRKYVHFTNSDEGHIVVTYDRAMGREIVMVLSTKDGGITWVEEGTIPGETITDSSEITFLNESVGFISRSSVDGNNSILYRTEDGGKNFSEVSFPVGTSLEPYGSYNPEWNKVYDTPEVPYFDENILTILVSQGSDGDYKAGRTLARYKSNDMGKTWEYIDQVIMKPDPSEG